MITDEQRREIEAEISKYAQKKAAASDVLKILQKKDGWISDETLKEAAAELEMTVDELYSTASVFNLIYHKPMGRHTILVCDCVSCWIAGYEKLMTHLKENFGIEFGQTTEDKRFTLLPVACLGACDVAPAIMIDQTLYGNVDIAKLGKILEEYK